MSAENHDLLMRIDERLTQFIEVTDALRLEHAKIHERQCDQFREIERRQWLWSGAMLVCLWLLNHWHAW